MTATKRDRSPKTRERRLRLHPLCAECLKAGITQPTEEIDHIIPLELGGPEEDSNTQGLCSHHNRLKRNKESYGHVAYGLDGWPIEEGVETDAEKVHIGGGHENFKEAFSVTTAPTTERT